MNILKILEIAGLVLGVILVLLIVVKIISSVNKRRKKKKEVRDAAENRIRYESLDQMILNERQVKTDRGNYQNPYDVSYEQGNALKRGKEIKQPMISLTEKNELSTKKYVFNVANPIKIGSSVKGNDVIVQGDGIADYQCMLFSDGKSIFVKNLSSISRTILSRKRDKAIVDENGLKLQTGDVITIGKITYKVTIVN